MRSFVVKTHGFKNAYYSGDVEMHNFLAVSSKGSKENSSLQLLPACAACNVVATRSIVRTACNTRVH